MQINNLSEYTFMSNHDFIEIPQNSSVELSVKTKNNLQEIEMNFEVFNALISPKTHPILTLKSIIQ